MSITQLEFGGRRGLLSLYIYRERQNLAKRQQKESKARIMINIYVRLNQQNRNRIDRQNYSGFTIKNKNSGSIKISVNQRGIGIF